MALKIDRCFLWLVLALAVCAIPAAAAPQITQDKYIESVHRTCNETSFCSVLFTPVVERHTLLISMASCKAVVVGKTGRPKGVVLEMTLAPSGLLLGPTRVHLPPASRSVDGIVDHYTFFETVFMAIPSAERSRMSLQMSASARTINLFCTISGELIFID